MSEKGFPIISQHEVGSSRCTVNNDSHSGSNNFKKPSSLSERKYLPSLNDKIIPTSSHQGCSYVPNFPSIEVLTNSKINHEQDLIVSNQASYAHALSPMSPHKITSIKINTNDSEFPLTSVVSSTSGSVNSGDTTIGSELPNVEEWLKTKSDSLSSLDLDSEIKNEIDMSDFLNLKSSATNSISSGTNLDQTKLAHEMGGIYSGETSAPSNSIMLNSLNFESDGSLSSVPTSAYDNPKSKSGNLGLLKKSDNLVQIDKNVFEEIVLPESVKKNFKIKDSILGDDKGLFEELLLPGVQEWLLTVSASDKKDSISSLPIDSIAIPQSPNRISTIPMNEQEVKDYDDYDMIGRNINTLKLMTPQEIENMPSRSLGFDEGQLKVEEEESIVDLPFESCDKELSDLPSGSSNEVDHKLFNILAMDASNDTLENHNFTDNILESINSETVNNDSNSSENNSCSANPKPVSNVYDSIVKGNFNCKSENKVNFSTNLFSSNGKSDTSITNNFNKNKEPAKKVLNHDTPIGKPLLNTKVLSKIGLCTGLVNSQINNDLKNKTLYHLHETNDKLKNVPIRIVQVELAPNFSKSVNVDKKKEIYSIPQTSIRPSLALQGPTSSTVPLLECGKTSPSFTDSSTDIPKQTPGKALTPHSAAGVAKVNISVNVKANTTNVSIVSSNKEHTVFKINTSDLMRAISSIKEEYLELLGLKNQQLVETANAAHKLLSIHSHISYLKNNQEPGSDNKTKNFEINQFIQEFKVPVSRSCNALSNVRHVETASTTKIPEEGEKEPNFVKNSFTITTESPESKREDDKNCHIKKLNVDKPKNPGENVGISLLPGAPPTMVSVPSVLDSLSGPTSSKVNLAHVLANCELSPSGDAKEEDKEDLQDHTSGEKTNNALVQLGINPNSLSPNVGPKGNKRWPCPLASCTKQFPKLSYLKVHILNHKGIRPYKCSYENCDWSFYTSYKLKRHLETHLKRRDFVCSEPNCSRRFTTIYNLNTHLTLHKQPKTWVCSLLSCGKAFRTRRELEAHMKLHTDVKPPYKCSVEGCLKAYFTPNSLASHTRSHHKEEDLRCQWTGCGKKFDKPCRLKAHMRVHTGQRPYVCNFEGCNWRFQCASKLSRHQRKHTNDRKYSCPICKKAFLRSEHLKGHLLTHTGVRNFQCPIANCEAKFTAKSSLYVHLKKHKTQKSDIKFHCPIEACDKSYDSKFNLRQHLLKIHAPVLTLDSSNLDYITLVSDKDLNDQILPQPAPSLDANKPAYPSFIPLSLQSASVEVPSTTGETNSTSDKGNNVIPPGNEDRNSTAPILSISNASSLTPDSNPDGAILSVPDGFFPFAVGDSSHTNSELGFPDLPVKESSSKGLVFQGSSAARTDVLGNIILSQRAKRRQQMSMARKLAATADLSKVNFCNDLILPTTTGDHLPSLPSHFQTSIMQDDGIPGALYEDLITRDLISDPSNDPQSTINLRDLE